MIVEKWSPFKFVAEFDRTLERLGLGTMFEEMDFGAASEFAENRVKSHMIFFVGLNPSKESPDNSAFHPSTKSGKAVREWVKDLNAFVSFANLSNDKNAPPKASLELKSMSVIAMMSRSSYKIISCGTVADTILKKNGIKHFAMPHPSGLNRFWNDKEKGDAKIKEMLEWVMKK